MKQLQLIFPYSLPPEDVAKDLQAQLKAPHFATLLGLTRVRHTLSQSDYAKAHLHEYIESGVISPFLAPQTDQSVGGFAQNSPPLAHALMQKFGILPSSGYWFLLQAVHLHVALDHLVLTDSTNLHLTFAQARQLFAMAKECCDDYGYELQWGDASHWFIRADNWADFSTSTLNAACGHNIEIWMAEGEHARSWRKLQNEIQMLWFSSDLHQERELAGHPAVNSLWLSHGSASLPASPPEMRIYSGDSNSISDLLNTNSACWLIKQLEIAWLNADWYSWLQLFTMLDAQLFAPLSLALSQGKVQQINLVLSRANQLSVHQIRAKAWWNFWHKPDLSALIQP